MSVEQPKVIDFLGHDVERNVVILTISDHLEWDDENEHLLVLQEKINNYLAFIEGGQLTSEYPQFAGLSIEIAVVLRHRPNEIAEQFFARAQEICREAGMALSFGPLEDGYYDKDC